MRRILLVDDDRDILDALQMLLEDLGYEVCVTTKGEEVLRQAEGFRAELVLLDLLLSGQDGRHICRELKAHPQLRMTRVIMMSAHPSARDSARAAGADGFVSKPFEVEALLRQIDSFAGGPTGAH